MYEELISPLHDELRIPSRRRRIVDGVDYAEGAGWHASLRDHGTGGVALALGAGAARPGQDRQRAEGRAIVLGDTGPSCCSAPRSARGPSRQAAAAPRYAIGSANEPRRSIPEALTARALRTAQLSRIGASSSCPFHLKPTETFLDQENGSIAAAIFRLRTASPDRWGQNAPMVQLEPRSRPARLVEKVSPATGEDDERSRPAPIRGEPDCGTALA